MGGEGSMEKGKRPETGDFEISTFRKALVELTHYSGPGSCNEAVIQACIDSINLLIEEGPKLRGMGLPVMKYVDSALHGVYPGLGSTDMSELKVLLEEEREILERIRDGSEVSDDEVTQVKSFCHSMWDQLDIKNAGKPPTRKR